MSTSGLQNSWINSYSIGGGGTPGSGTFTSVAGSATILSSSPLGPTTIISANPAGLIESVGAGSATLHGAVVVSTTNNTTGAPGLSVVANATSATTGTLAFNYNSTVGGSSVNSITSSVLTNPATGDITLSSTKATFTGAGGTNATIVMAMNDDFAVADITATGTGAGTGGLQMSGAVEIATGTGVSFAGSTASASGVGGKLVISSTASGGAIQSGRATMPLAGTLAISLSGGAQLTATSIILLTWCPDTTGDTVQATPVSTLGVLNTNWAVNPGSFTVTANPVPVAVTQFVWALVVA